MGKQHEWHERTDEGDVRYVRATLFGGSWSFEVRLKSVGIWEPVPRPSLEDLQDLRDVLWGKYQRGRVPHAHVVALDRLLELRDDGA